MDWSRVHNGVCKASREGKNSTKTLHPILGHICANHFSLTKGRFTVLTHVPGYLFLSFPVLQQPYFSLPLPCLFSASAVLVQPQS